jgi:hypothetical protein
MEPHIFNCTLGFPLDASGATVTVVSEDQTIRTTLPATVELLGMFESGEYQVKCDGFWDGEYVWLGKKLKG